MKQRLVVQIAKDPKTGRVKEKDIFDLFTDEKNTALQYSALDGKWSRPGTNIAKIFNDGNGLNVWLDGGRAEEPLKFRLNYSQSDALRLALKIEQDGRDERRKETFDNSEFVVDKLSDIEPKPAEPRKLTVEEIRDAIDEMDEEEVMLVHEAALNRFVDRGWQWGDILGNVYQWLRGHAPGAREEYLDGTFMDFFYGSKDVLKKMLKKRKKK